MIEGLKVMGKITETTSIDMLKRLDQLRAFTS
jgi:hypothetical protein